MGNNHEMQCADVLKRLCDALKVDSDVELAKALGVANNTISGWRTRNKVPYEKIIDISLKNNFAVEQILFGENIVKPQKQENRNLLLLKGFAAGVIQKKLFFYIYNKLNSSFPLQEQLSDGEVESVFSQIWNSFHSVEKQIPNLFECPLEEIYEIADVIIADDIEKYKNLMELVKSREKNTNESFNSNQNFNGPVGQVSGRDINNNTAKK